MNHKIETHPTIIMLTLSQNSVMMVTLDSLEDHPLLCMKVVWNSAMVKSGVLSVMTPGMIQMPLWCAGS
jgi:hypothetical protein